MRWTLRAGTVADAPACHAVYVDAIRNGTGRHYTTEQALAWAPSDTVEAWMPPRLQTGITWIAEVDARAVGFLTVTPGGHLDFFFVRPDARASGLAIALYDRMMTWADEHGLDHLTTYASHLARSFLERRGWATLARETSIRHGVALDRWELEWKRPKV